MTDKGYGGLRSCCEHRGRCVKNVVCEKGRSEAVCYLKVIPAGLAETKPHPTVHLDRGPGEQCANCTICNHADCELANKIGIPSVGLVDRHSRSALTLLGETGSEAAL